MSQISLTINQDIILAPYTTLKIGGAADYFVAVETREELLEAIQLAYQKQVPFYILGAGSNVLVADHGYRGLIIKIRNPKSKIRNSTVIAEAGASLPSLAKQTAEAGLSGLEFAIGVPGTVGGAVYGNAGAFGQETKDVLTFVHALMPEANFIASFKNQKDCSIVSDEMVFDLSFPRRRESDTSNTKWAFVRMSNRACEFAYRESIFKKHKPWIILEAQFNLKRETPEICTERMQTILKDKTTNQPMGQFAAGSIFKNPSGYSAWELISQANLKNFKIGGALVSPHHANYIINSGGGSAEHVVMLISTIKQRVLDRFGVHLKEEIQYIGF